MRAIDTNIVVRYVAGDGGDQALKARAIVDGSHVFISATVLLECEWVLRSAYGYEPPQIAAALRAIAGLSTVTLQDRAEAWRALDWMERGLDFADALHLALARQCASFVSFDKGMIKAARRLGITTIEAP